MNRLSGVTFTAFIIAALVGCVELTTQGGGVRVTTNPDVVRPCRFLGNVKATSGWGGPAGTGLASSNTEKTLQNKTADLGGNVVFVDQAGIHASGEAYACGGSPAQNQTIAPHAEPQRVRTDLIQVTERAADISGCKAIGSSAIRMTISALGVISGGDSAAAREQASAVGGDTVFVTRTGDRTADGVVYRCGH